MLLNFYLIQIFDNNQIQSSQQTKMSKFFQNQSDSQNEVEKQVKKGENSQSDNDENQQTKQMSKAQKKKERLRRKKQQQKRKQEEQFKGLTAKVQDKQQDIKVQQTKQQKKQDSKQIEIDLAVQKQEEDKQQVGGKKKKDKKKAKPLTGAALLAQKKLQEQKKFQQQQQRKKRQFQQQQNRIIKEAEQKAKREEQQRKRKQQEQKERIKILKKKGTYVSKKKQAEIQRAREQFQRQKKAEEQAVLREKEVKEKIDKGQQIVKTEQQLQKQRKKNEKIQKKERAAGIIDDMQHFQHKTGKFRSPICCILGHVDTGKTTLLDRIRNTNVQQGQAGGITQQIGATFFPEDKLEQQLEKLKCFKEIKLNLPGLMIIDTPGHESFSNLRSRGSSLCDIAILVIDLMHGLQNQTLQSLELLKKGKTPFVVALNKIDRCYGWKSEKGSCSRLALQNQKVETRHDFETKLQKIITQLNQKGYNAALYWENEDPQQYISLIPTSGITGEGLPDILGTIVQYSGSIERILKRIKVKKGRFNCTIMEVKMTEGHGTTIDCILVDGSIKKQDQIVFLGFNGPIITKVKALLTPHPMKEMRIKDQYLHHKVVHAANGVKISAPNLDSALAGSPLIVANSPDEVEDAIAICENAYDDIKKKIVLQDLGVGVAASTLGSLQALLEYLKTQNIPVSHISVGPVSKDHIVKAMKATISQTPEKRKKQYACLLVFDVKVRPEAQKYAQDNSIKIFTANIIYHLTDYFNKYVKQVRQQRKANEGKDAVFPCILKQVAQFRKSDPIVLGVDVEYGVLRIGTPICVYRQKQKGQKQVRLGYVESIEHNHKKIKQARKATGSVAVSLSGDASILAGRQFQLKDRLVSMMTRKSIDCLKEHYRDQMQKQDWGLVIQLKKYFNIA